MEACHSFRTQWIETEDFQWFGDLVYAALSLICFNLYFRKMVSVYSATQSFKLQLCGSDSAV